MCTQLHKYSNNDFEIEYRVFIKTFKVAFFITGVLKDFEIVRVRMFTGGSTELNIRTFITFHTVK